MNSQSDIDNKQKQRLNYLISILIKEVNYKTKIPNDLKGKHYIYKCLCNLRSPKKVSNEFIKVEEEYLQERLKSFHLINISDINSLSITHPFLLKKSKIKNISNICLWKGDITKLQIDAIVNAGNSGGLGCFSPGHSCIDNQIHTSAGVRLRLECFEYMKKINGKLKDGKAMITNAYNLPCKKVIQTVGPCLERGKQPTKKQKNTLGDCYTNSLKLLLDNKLYSIAFPAISTGVFGFPKKTAAKIALERIDEFISGLNETEAAKIKVVLSVYDDANLKIYESVIKE